MNDLEKAINLLKDPNTCILIKDDECYIDQQRGIRPMLDFINQGIDLKGFSVADKIVGKAVSMLFVYAGIKHVYAEVISSAAIEVLEKYHISYQYKIKTNIIINRQGNDICPMEKAVSLIDDINQAYLVLQEKI